jgi:6,7-dimethyl-8-ribityllumazine synthase
MQHSTKGQFKKFNAKEYRVAIVVAQFNRDVTEAITEQAVGTLKDYGVVEENMPIHRVAGSVEIPVILKALADTNRYDAVVVVGAIIRGSTDHYVHVANIVVDGVNRTMATGLPVGFAVLTVENHAQAVERIEIGRDAVVAALHAAKIVKSIEKFSEK